MRHPHSIPPHRIVAPAARSALHFAAPHRATRRREAWRPIALFWRQKRKGLERAHTTRLTLAAGAVRHAQFHLYFIIRETDRAPRHSTRGLSSIAASHQKRVVMEHRRTIIQSRMFLVQPHGAQSTVQVSSLRHTQSDSGTKLQSAASYAHSGRRSIAPAIATWTASRPERPARVSSSLHTRNDSRIKVQGATQYTDSSRRPIVSLIATWAVEHDRRPYPGRTQLGVRRETSTDAQAWIFEASQPPKLGPLLISSRSAAMRSA